MVQRAFEKIRQTGVGMPAVMIRQLDALYTILEQTSNPDRRQILLDQAEMIMNSCVTSVADREDVQRSFQALSYLRDLVSISRHRLSFARPAACVHRRGA